MPSTVKLGAFSLLEDLGQKPKGFAEKALRVLAETVEGSKKFFAATRGRAECCSKYRSEQARAEFSGFR